MIFNKSKRFSSWLLCSMLIVAMAFTSVGCGKNGGKSSSDWDETTKISESVLGEGQTKFMFTVVDKDGNETDFEVHTDKKIVGDALQDVGLISGEEGEFGLYVKSVNGITADFDKDKTYWAFYVDGEYATSGVDSTKIKEGEKYSFKIEK